MERFNFKLIFTITTTATKNYRLEYVSNSNIISYYIYGVDRLCGLVVSVADYKTQRSRVRFPGTPYDFSEGVGSGTGSTQPRDRIN
jgi:hypothetical protein